MKIVIVYPVPCETAEVWALFKPFVNRFTDSLRGIDSGCEYLLSAVVNGSEPWPEDLKPMFEGLNVEFRKYEGRGFDIGSFQFFAEQCPDPCFMVCCVTRVYSWLPGWLKKLSDARTENGPGLYATSMSMEGGKIHVCTRCYGMDSEDFKKYPVKIVSRDQGTFFEVYDGSLFEWYARRNMPVVLVNATACVSFIGEHPPCYIWTRPNIYRSGNQSQVIVWDKHTDAYRDADDNRKRELERWCFTGRA